MDDEIAGVANRAEEVAAEVQALADKVQPMIDMVSVKDVDYDVTTGKLVYAVSIFGHTTGVRCQADDDAEAMEFAKELFARSIGTLMWAYASEPEAGKITIEFRAEGSADEGSLKAVAARHWHHTQIGGH